LVLAVGIEVSVMMDGRAQLAVYYVSL
jgi:hypothetical protein